MSDILNPYNQGIEAAAKAIREAYDSYWRADDERRRIIDEWRLLGQPGDCPEVPQTKALPDHLAEAIRALRRPVSPATDTRDAVIAELRAALKPFADEATRWTESQESASLYCLPIYYGDGPTVGDLRRARAALSAVEGSK